MDEKEKPDVLNIKKERQQAYRFHYSREERLQMKSGSGINEPAGKKSALKRNFMLIIIAVFMIILLIIVFVIRQNIR